MTGKRTAIHPAEKRSLLGMGAAVVALHLGGWGTLFLLVLPQLSRTGGDTAVMLGLAVSAYLLGVRHAVDADHIVAIDNTTRRLVGAGRRSVSVGFWFALGHSSVVVVSVVLLVLGVNAFAGGLADDTSALRQVTGVWGAAVSGVFLILMGALNLSSLKGLRQVLRDVRTGSFVQSELDGHLENRGVINRLLRPMSRLVDRPWKMLPIGLLFGLGLDTAASISLFVFAGVLTPGLPWYAALVLPVVFTAGMTLVDSADGILMNHVYQWASADPLRKVHYNLIVTGVSVFVAFFVGGMGLMAMFTDLGIGGGTLQMLTAVDLTFRGPVLFGVFALTGLLLALWARFRPSLSLERHS
ncbi:MULTISPECIES: HoxN/HupN/NixA family nickel/cobalt transporter [unclassified Cryobacterium]|uniref:HoxN/HupN/NixA family nickel/cobalt transporter n=1 Tax=unclassified Cryobacterium TaxID=2649013 RepID=UPI0018E09071|nr:MULTISPECIES: HoxN/HupN/NixA family nickel/cobalt transporter [unclassified Cryobacterium]